jgi:Ca-activated chloride channel family protein
MKVEAKFEFPNFSTNQRNENNLLIRLQTPPVLEGKRQPLVVGLAIDKSWSMKGEKMDAVIEAASSLVNWLTRIDYLSIIAYSNDIQVVQPLTNLTEKISVTDKIQSIQVATSTNLSGGYLQTLRSIETKGVQAAVRRVILLTDGNPTIGIKESEAFVEIAKSHFASGISTTTIGVGEDFNEEMLRSIAEAGGGNFYFIDSPEKAGEIFFQEFGEIGALYAQATELEIGLPTGIEYNSIWNTLPVDIKESIGGIRGDQGGEKTQTVKIQVGDIRSDDIKNIVLNLRSNNPIIANPKISIGVSYYNLLDSVRLEKTNQEIPVGLGKESGKQDPDVLVEMLVIQTATAIHQSSEALRNRNIPKAEKIVAEQILLLQKNKHYAPNSLGSLLNRLQILEAKIQENSEMASKAFTAVGSSLSTKGSDALDLKDVQFHDDVYYFNTEGDIDLYKCPEIKAAVYGEMKNGHRFFIFDLSDTSHIDSSAIGTLIQIVGWLRRRNGDLIVCGLKDSVRKVFEITKLYNHIRVTDSRRDAEDAISRLIISREGDRN